MPISFNDFGKQNKDLFSKKYDFGNSVKIINKAASGVEMETSLKGTNAANRSGAIKATVTCAKHGKAEFTASSAAKPLIAAKFTTTKLVDGLKLTVSGNEKPCGKVEADYARDNFSASAALSCGSGSPALALSGAFGSDGVSIGGSAAFDASSFAIKEFGAGWQYTQNDFTGTVRTRTVTDGADTVTASYFFKARNATNIGASFEYDLNAKSSLLSLGTHFNYGADTAVKVKANSKGVVCAAIEQTLSDPSMKINMATEFGAGSACPFLPAKKFGFGVTLGDF